MAAVVRLIRGEPVETFPEYLSTDFSETASGCRREIRFGQRLAKSFDRLGHKTARCRYGGARENTVAVLPNGEKLSVVSSSSAIRRTGRLDGPGGPCMTFGLAEELSRGLAEPANTGPRREELP
jgi:hypothetical protein